MQGAHLDDACEDGEHKAVWDSRIKMTVCDKCGLSSQTIVDSLGHDFTSRTTETSES